MVIISWIAKVDMVLPDGIIIKEGVEKHPFKILISNKEFGKIRHNKVFNDNVFKKGDKIKITINDTEKREPLLEKRDGYIKYNGIVYSIYGDVIYIKDVSNEDRFSSLFRFQGSGMIMDDVYLNDDLDADNMPFEKGDIIEIEVERI